MADIRPFCDRHPRIDPDAWLDPRCTVIGDVWIAARCSVWPGVVIRGDVNRIRIGRETNIQDNSVLHNSHDSEYLPGGTPLVIGERVTVGHGVILHGCEVGDLCLIGMGAIVMDQAMIEPEVILGAGSLVPGGKVLESGHLYTGSPARQVRPLSDREREYLAYSAQHYVQLAGKHAS
ncbi:MAG: gamma carbonic anhydrase family protein [Gammaproteobacteria bacterium]|nr:MAG: gamma carbonic anhydrase family protein [Gammaproteobacteria bacterium]